MQSGTRHTRRSLEWHMTKVFVLLAVVSLVLMFAPRSGKSANGTADSASVGLGNGLSGRIGLNPNRNHSVLQPAGPGSPANDEDDDECDDPAGADDPCEYVREFCGEIGSPIDYLEIYYCEMKGDVPDAIVMILALFWLSILFYMLGTTGDAYFCPALIRVSKFLKLPHDVMGVTFLALGNGAPDIFSVFASLTSDDMDIALGGLLGAGLFVVALVFGGVTIASDLVVNPHLFVRDISMYVVGVTGLFITTMDEKIYVFEPPLFITLYILYVLAVFYRHKLKSVKGEYQILKNEISSPESGSEATIQVRTDYDDDDDEDEDDDDDDDKPWSEKSLLMKIIFIITYPTIVARDYSIPPCRNSDWNKNRAAAFPTFALLLFLFVLQGENMFTASISGDFLAVYLFVIIGLILSAAVYFTVPQDSIPKNTVYQGFFIFGAFAMSIMWIYISAGMTVSLLQSLGLTIGVSNAILGITVLAWGNSIGDLVSNISVAANGKPQMSVSACYAGPLFNMCIGMGITLLLTTIKDSPFTFSMASGNVITFVSLLLCLVITLAVVWFNNWKSPKYLGYFLVGYYILFLIITGLNEGGLMF